MEAGPTPTLPAESQLFVPEQLPCQFVGGGLFLPLALFEIGGVASLAQCLDGPHPGAGVLPGGAQFLQAALQFRPLQVPLRDLPTQIRHPRPAALQRPRVEPALPLLTEQRLLLPQDFVGGLAIKVVELRNLRATGGHFALRLLLFQLPDTEQGLQTELEATGQRSRPLGR